MLEKYKVKQFLFYKYISKSFEFDKISHAYLIQTNNVDYSFELALDFSKFLLCDNIFDEKICNLIDNNSYDNFMLIDSNNIIKKDEIIKLQDEFSFKSINGKRKVYLIKNAEALNDSSANSLLKFLEEPQDNIVAILLANNINNVKNTILSRCQIINLVNNDKFDYKTIFDYYDESTGLSKDEFIEKECVRYFNFYDDIEKKGSLVLENKDIYDFCFVMNQLLKFGLYLYFDLINVILERETEKYLPDSSIKINILEKNDLTEIVNKVDLIEKFLILNRFNVNKNLFLDNFVVKFGGDK